MRFVTRNHTNGKIVLDSTTSSSPARTSREMVFIYRCATRFDVAPTMSPRAPLSRLDDSEESHARLNAADGVPEHLRDHLGVPDKEVFELKAKLNALQRTLESTETERVEALKVAASATARCDSFEERAAGRLDKARTRAETAERAAEDSERRADVGARTRVSVLTSKSRRTYRWRMTSPFYTHACVTWNAACRRFHRERKPPVRMPPPRRGRATKTKFCQTSAA